MTFIITVIAGLAAKAMRSCGYKGAIIGVTGNALDYDKEIFMRNGANKVLVKPLDITAFDLACKGMFIQPDRLLFMIVFMLY